MASINGSDPCAVSASSGVTGLHIAAPFIILTASALGVGIPLVGHRYAVGHKFFFLMGKHIGTGVLLSLSLVHLLSPAIAELSSPCLGNATMANYPFAILIAIYACLVMHFIETSVQILVEKEEQRRALLESPQVPSNSLPDIEYVHALVDAAEGTHGSPKKDTESLEAPDDDHQHKARHKKGHGHSHGGGLLPRGFTSTKKMVSAYMLEFGLTTHSITIGLATGISSYEQMVPLLIALCFHQFFEGFALGACLSEAGFSYSHEVALSLLFCFSAPVGIAVGVASQSSYNANSPSALIAAGVLDSIGAGIVLYVALVQMFTEFGIDIRLVHSTLGRFVLYSCVWLGAGVMCLIGVWL